MHSPATVSQNCALARKCLSTRPDSQPRTRPACVWAPLMILRAGQTYVGAHLWDGRSTRVFQERESTNLSLDPSNGDQPRLLNSPDIHHENVEHSSNWRDGTYTDFKVFRCFLRDRVVVGPMFLRKCYYCRPRLVPILLRKKQPLRIPSSARHPPHLLR